MADATQEERWLPVPGYEGHYEVSDLGRVRSLPRTIVRRDGVTQPIRGRILKPGGGRGHQHVNLALNGVHNSLWVHRLVLDAFVGPCPPGEVCCHWDDNPTNNSVENLRWATKGDNTRDAVRNGIHWRVSRTRCARGHPLAVPNLVPSELAARGRKCLACDRATSRANSYIRSGAVRRDAIDMQALADAYYAEIAAAGDATTSIRRGRRHDIPLPLI